MDIQYYLDIVSNYFIDYAITIDDNDSINIKIRKILLKYKRVIALIFLILLLIIGYYCNPYVTHLETNTNTKTQNGGATDPPAQTPTPAPTTTAPEPAASAPAAAPEPKVKKTKKERLKAYGTKKSEQIQASAQLKSEKHAAALKEAKQKAKDSVKKAFKPSTYYDAGASAARAFKDNADVIFQIFYSIAIFILLCIVTIPAFAFIVVGIICYVILKDKMKAIKAL